MDEKEFMMNVWDLLNGNTEYFTQKESHEKYRDLMVEVDCENKFITLRDDHNEWRLSLQKVWCELRLNYQLPSDYSSA